MRLIDFPEDKESKENMNDLKMGDYFLYGKSVIAQKETKKIGDSISYYEVISKSRNGIEYVPIFDYMEEDDKEEDKNK